MDLKKLIEEHEQLKTNERLTNNLILKEITKCLMNILPRGRFAEYDGMHYTEIRKKVNENFNYQIPEDYIYVAANSIKDIEVYNGKYIITK